MTPAASVPEHIAARLSCIGSMLDDAGLEGIRHWLDAAIAREPSKFIGADGELNEYAALVLRDLIYAASAPNLSRAARKERVFDALILSGLM